MKYKISINILLNPVFLDFSHSQENKERTLRAYTLTFEKENFKGREAMGITINRTIPGLTMEFMDR